MNQVILLNNSDVPNRGDCYICPCSADHMPIIQCHMEIEQEWSKIWENLPEPFENQIYFSHKFSM